MVCVKLGGCPLLAALVPSELGDLWVPREQLDPRARSKALRRVSFRFRRWGPCMSSV